MAMDIAAADAVNPIRWWSRLRSRQTRLRGQTIALGSTSAQARGEPADPFRSFDSFAATEWADTEWPDTCVEATFR
jgi:hypothetical protein